VAAAPVVQRDRRGAVVLFDVGQNLYGGGNLSGKLHDQT
jgi:hypothetical protein